jgi:hypothetical protein
MKLLMRCAAALVLAGALTGASLAQDQTPPQGTPGQDQGPPDQRGQGGHHGAAVRAACQADIAKLCSADEAGEGGHGAFRCLRDHQDAVSDSCKSAMATARAERQAHGGWSHGPGGPGGGGGPPDDGAPPNGAQPQN